MQAGDVLGERFTVSAQIACDVPGIDRFEAHDARLDRVTIVSVIAEPGAHAAQVAAHRASLIRDPRLARIVVVGSAVVGSAVVGSAVVGSAVVGSAVVGAVADSPATFVAAEHVPGTTLADILERGCVATGALSARQAVAIIAGAARALGAAGGLHHGMLRPAAVTVTERGRVVVTGLGFEAAAAQAAGADVDASDQADARALVSLLVAVVTGRVGESGVVPGEPADLPADLPAGFPAGAAQVVTAALRGEYPASVDQVISALSPFDARALVGFTLEPVPVGDRQGDSLDLDVAESAGPGASLLPGESVTPAEPSDDSPPAHDSPEANSPDRAPTGPTQATQAVGPTQPAVPTQPSTPAPVSASPGPGIGLHEAPGIPPTGVDTLEFMVAAQQTPRRAGRPGRLSGTAVVLIAALLTVVVALGVALSLLAAPLHPSITIESPPAHRPGGAVTGQ